MSHNSEQPGLSWLSIIRLGLVQSALGSIVVLTTSTLNRVMVVELGLAATIPGALVGLHYGVQISRPLWGHSADGGGGRTRWIIAGLLMLALAGTGAAATTLLFADNFYLAMAAAVLCFTVIGFGIGAAGTSLLALLASRTAPTRRPAAATIVWMMMIAGIIATAVISGQYLEPYSHERLVTVTAIAGAISCSIAGLAVLGIERRAVIGDDTGAPKPTISFRQSFAETWADPQARLFTIFVFVAMLSYSTQDLILEPFAGLLYGMTPGESTQLGGMQHGGVFIGMALVGIAGTLMAKRKPEILKLFTVTGCIGSGIALAFLAASASLAPAWPLKANVFILGFANGVFAVAAIGTMMTLAGGGGGSREGIRMGLWGAAQAVAFGLGGFLGTVSIDATRALTGDVPLSFAIVFGAEAALFIVAAMIATRVGARPAQTAKSNHGPLILQPAE